MTTKHDTHDDLIAKQAMINDQREANAQMVHTTIRAQELADDAEAGRAKAEATTNLVRESEERYRALFDLCPAAVYSCEYSGLIQNFNRHAVELWGRTPASGDTDERFCGSFKLYRPDGSFMPHELCPMAEVLSGKISEARDAEVVIERPDGSRVTCIVNIRPLKNQRGEVTAAINCFYDITERKRAEEERTELDNVREQLLAIVGHDLRSPLSAIVMGAALMLQRGTLDDLGAKTAARIARSADRMAKMISQLLDFTRARLGGGIPIERTPVELANVCAEVIAEYEIARPDRVLRFDTALDTEGLWDGGRIAQLATNLIGNAIQYGEPDRVIDIRVTSEGADVHLSVHNDGPPIAVNVLPSIFSPFRRGKVQGKSQTESLGLGLFIAREIVLAHGGEIEVESTETTGTTFTARLPRKPAPRHD
jgi:signal transduction histidine kinase